MARSSPRVSLVIRALDEADHLPRLLDGVLAQTLRPDEVELILVDSGSRDRTVAIAERYGCRIVRIDKGDFSFGRALNLGCEAATGEFLVFASAHVYPVHHDWLERLIAPFADPRVALSYGRQRGGPTNKYSEHRLFEAWFPPESTANQATYFCNNANCAIRREAWLANRYDELLTGLEDLDWAKQAQKRGGRIAYVAEASVVHVHDESWPQVRNRYFREALALRQIEPHMRFGWRDYVALLSAHVLSDAYHAYQDGVLSRQWRNILQFRHNQLWGTFLGYRRTGPVTQSLKTRFYYPTRRPGALAPRAPATADVEVERPEIVYSSQ